MFEHAATRFRPPPSARESRRACAARGGPSERRARRLRPQAPHARCPRRRARAPPSSAGGNGARVELGERALGVVEPADQQQAAHREIARVRGIRAIAVLLRASRAPRRAPSSASRGRARPSAISASATTQRARATASFGPNARAARRSSAFARAKIAELRHRDAAQRERRRVVAQRDALQRAERIARRECARRGRDQRVHSNPVTLVTLTLADAPRLTSPRQRRIVQQFITARRNATWSDILHRVGIKASPNDAYKALTTREGLAGWWTTDTQGDSEVGGSDPVPLRRRAAGST